jgi:hypothetical protein
MSDFLPHEQRLDQRDVREYHDDQADGCEQHAALAQAHFIDARDEALPVALHLALGGSAPTTA